MGEWIGDRASEAVNALRSRLEFLENEIKIAHMTLDTYDIPTSISIGEMGRPLTLSERIQIDHENNRKELLIALDAQI
jgi:hypothetical protein